MTVVTHGVSRNDQFIRFFSICGSLLLRYSILSFFLLLKVAPVGIVVIFFLRKEQGINDMGSSSCTCLMKPISNESAREQQTRTCRPPITVIQYAAVVR